MFQQPHLCIERRILGHDDQMVDRVQAKADAVKGFVVRKLEWESQCISPELVELIVLSGKNFEREVYHARFFRQRRRPLEGCCGFG
jgi:hypothetical protein